jgi:beta-glucosidase
MLHQRSPAVPHLALAEFWTGMEGVHGASWRDHGGTGEVLPATVFPQPPGIAASWDPELARDLGRATGREIRALHDEHPQIGLNVWAPVVNLLRDPRWGRNEEGYSEDPLLTALVGTAFGQGLSGSEGVSGDGLSDNDAGGYLLTAPTLKHFLGYNNEDFRDLTSSGLRARVLQEYDLPPFRAPIEAGAATGVMPSYNLVNGRPAHVSPLLREIRDWTDQELLTCSDAFAPSNLAGSQHYFGDHPQAHAAALRAGLDSFTDKDGGFTAAQVTEALARGLITMDDVDRAVRRKLLIRLRLGEFDPDGGPFATAAAIDTPAHRELAGIAARRAAVLLTNDGLLPLSLADTALDDSRPTTIAVVGPLADTLCEDWYSPALPYRVTIADGLAAAATAATGATVTVHEGADRVRTDLGDFDVFDWGADIVTLRGTTSDNTASSDGSAGDDTASDGTARGRYLTVADGGTLAVTADRPHGWTVRETFHRTLMPGGTALLVSTATRQSFLLRWDLLSDGTAGAVAVARGADVAVVVVGNDPMIGGREAHDRSTLALPPSMDLLVREVTAACPRTVVVIMSSYPYLVPDAPAIIWTCHAGQETGHAIADLITGRHAPEGRLPQTWYAADADLPDPLDYDIIKAGWTYQYTTARPRFPFGHGLTYTTFGYGPLVLEARRDESPVFEGTVFEGTVFEGTAFEGTLFEGIMLEDTAFEDTAPQELTATLDVTNLGTRDGTEVVQLYASYSGPGQPRRRLCGFTRVTLRAGETATARIVVPLDRLRLWDVAAGRMSMPLGPVEISAGASSADIRQVATLTVPAGIPARRPAQVAAADFDDYSNIALVDTTREAGTAVTPADQEQPGWLTFTALHPERMGVAVFRVACSAPSGGRIEVWPAPPDVGADTSHGADENHGGDTGPGPLASICVPWTGDRYAWAEVSAPVPLSPGADEVCLVVHGPVRLDWFRL